MISAIRQYQLTTYTREQMSNVQQFNFAKYQPTEAIEKENRAGYIDYGDNNLYPQYLINLYHNSPIHNALVNSIAFMISGKGTNTILDNALNGLAFDLKLQGQFVAEIIWSLDGTRVAQINHLPFENCRLAYDKDCEEVTGVYYSYDWANTRSKKGKPTFIPLFDPSCAKEYPRQVIYDHSMCAGSMFYAKPDYYGSLNYVELSYQMGLYHVNNILNGLFPSFIINFLNGIPQKEEREQIRREWESRLSGASNAGKFLMTFNEDPTRAPQIESFPLSDADKQYEFLSDETAKQIMIGHRITSPLLFGIRDVGGGFGSNKDEMIVALDIFNHQVIQPYQRLITDVFEPILGNVQIEQNSPFEIVETAMPTETIVVDTPATTTDIPVETKVSDVTYNGAQIASAIDVIAKVKEGILTQEQAIVFLVQFLQLDVEVAKSMFVVGGGSDAVAKLSSQKKKVKKKKAPQLIDGVPAHISEEDSHAWLSHLADKAEYVDEEEWECISDEEVTDPHNEEAYRKEYMSLRSYAKPNERSDETDKGLYKIRYYYSKNLTWRDGEMVTRDFCREMVALSKNSAVYRYEDIIAMEGENSQFAPEGSSSYSIWEWKGGCFCHHKWFRKIYFRKRKGGQFLPNKGLANDSVVKDNVDTLKPKGVEAIRPIDTPSRGSLKYK
jgi:hypothetical protein